MADLDDLSDALRGQDWKRALSLALVAWRGSRSVELADLIDRITANCDIVVPAGVPAEQQKWWVQSAQIAERRDPVTTAALLSHLAERADFLDAAIEDVRRRWSAAKRTPLSIHLGSSNRWPTNFQERVALLLDWEDDPRVAMTVVDTLRAPQAPHAHGIPEMYDALADRIAEIGDNRVLAKLEAMATEPRGGRDVLRRLQAACATRALAGFANRKSSRERVAIAADELAACIALLPPLPAPSPAPPRDKIEALWREVAANPDDVGTRAVLGDALVEAGDLRGDLIVLQCNARVPNRPLRSSNRTAYDGRVKTLLRKQWDVWMEDLALVVARRASEFRCGMLEVATVGLSTSPDWAFTEAKGHRELACVHTVRPGWITSDNFATFVLGLPRFPRTLGVTGIDVMEKLATRGATFERLATIEMMRSPVTGPNDRPNPDWTDKPFREALARLAVLVPHLRELVVKNHVIAGLFVPNRREVRMMFPALKRLAVDEATALTVRPLVDDNLFEVVPATVR